MKYTNAMLAETASLDMLPGLIAHDGYLAEQKIDGHRCLMHIEDGRIAPVARSGLPLGGVSADVLNKFKPFLDSDTRWVFDGEYLAGCYYIFDLIEAGNIIGPGTPLHQRRTALEHFWTTWAPTGTAVALLPAARTTGDKERLVDKVKGIGGEGVMFKKVDSAYVGKRTNSILKVKFRNEVDAIVLQLGIDGKENMLLGVYDANGDIMELGECTRLAGDGHKINVGDVVTVTYQYVTNSGRLFHPTLPKLRTDKPASLCTSSQLVYVNKDVLTAI